MRALRFVVGMALVVALAGCGDSRPEGPGAVQARVVTGDVQVGALVLQLNGTGIGAVSGLGTTRAFAEDPSAASKRVVLISASGSSLGMTIQLDDLSLPLPTATVVEGIDIENRPITELSGISVRVELAEDAQ